MATVWLVLCLIVSTWFSTISASESGYTEHVGTTGSGADQLPPVKCSNAASCFDQASAACTNNTKCVAFAFDPTCLGTGNPHCGTARLFKTKEVHPATNWNLWIKNSPTPPPSPPPPSPPPSPSPHPTNCTENNCQPGCACLPKWKPTWNMSRSTALYIDQPNGFHNVSEAIRWGVAVYDWSNAKKLWTNARPMNCDELLTKQAEMVLAADPGVPGEQPRVWVYRNTAKALNFFGSVREKLDDPLYAGWFIRYSDAYTGE